MLMKRSKAAILGHPLVFDAIDCKVNVVVPDAIEVIDGGLEDGHVFNPVVGSWICGGVDSRCSMENSSATFGA